LGCARGGAIVTNNRELFREMQQIGALYEGIITYGGMSIMEIEAINVYKKVWIMKWLIKLLYLLNF